VDLLTERFGQPAQQDKRKGEGGDKYNKYTVVLLATLCGHRGSPEAMEDLTMEHLPELWHQMQNMRSRNSHLRTFMEGYIAEKLAVSMWHYRFLLMTDMLHMLRGLDFTGDDPDTRWACRMRGMSLWSLVPQDERRHGEYSERRQRMIDYEDMADNHLPGNCAESTMLVVPDAHAPSAGWTCTSGWTTCPSC
jgi:hypothetical protein